MNSTTTQRPRYTPTLRRLHWLMAVLILLAYVLIEQRGLFPKGTPERTMMVQGHYWMGISIFVLAWWRLASRRRSGAPPIVPPLDKFSAIFAKLAHLALYAFFIVMPILGLMTVWTDGKQVLLPFTDIALPALLAVDKDQAETLEDIHKTIGSIFYWVVGIHIAAAVWHHMGRRDNTLERML